MEGGTSPGRRSGPARTSSGPGRLLVLVYGIFALSATARAAVQIATKFDEAPLAYVLSALAAVVYVCATVGLARIGARSACRHCSAPLWASSATTSPCV